MTGVEPKPPEVPRWIVTFGHVWPIVISIAGLVGCGVLLAVPSLRDPTAWMIAGGASGILPVNRLLEAFSVLGGKK